ncbi:MAG: radical SAM protein [Planctomycetota bacterium]|nr:radical SAM protein [Planctomycetota bacterium]
MRVLLLSAPVVYKGKFGRKFFVPYSPPIGIASIAAVLARAGHEVECVDMLDWTMDAVRNRLRQSRPELVGITCLTEQRAGVFQVADVVKQMLPATPVVLGGPHPTLLWKDVLMNHPSVDFIVMGEGENTMLELTDALSNRREIDSIAGIAFRRRISLRPVSVICTDASAFGKGPDRGILSRPPSGSAGGGKQAQNDKTEVPERNFPEPTGVAGFGSFSGDLVVSNSARPLIEDLNTLPFPEYKYFDLDSYRPYQPPKYRRLKYAPINSSRGCVAKCQFCSVPAFWGNRWRGRSARNVVDEIASLHAQGRRFFNFTDDLFSVNPGRVIEISRELVARGLDVKWDFETRPNFVNEQMLAASAKAGCVMIAYGVESGSQKILERVNKQVTRSRIVEAFAMTKACGIRAHALLMIGNPGESDETIAETCALIRETRPDSVAVQLTTVYPGTALYEHAKSVGFISDDYWLTDEPAPFYTVERNLSTLRRWQDRVLAESDRGMRRLTRKVQLLLSRVLGLRISKEGVTREK